MAPTASTSALQQQLHLASARRATFNKTRKGANKALNWPYPLTAAAARTSTIHPDRLVEAGFYCTPTHNDPTVTTCFLCEIVIGQWEEGEDPLYRHEAAIDEAEIRCGWLDVLNQSWTKEGADGLALTPKETWPEIWGDEMHPRGERMAWARLATFRLGWPHEGQEGVPTKQEIAAAGWVFRPGAEEESQDQCACIYCGRTVEGWEQGDDPVALHKRKIGLKCPFFLADDLATTSEPSASAKAIVNPIEPVEDATEEDEPEPEVVKPKRGSRKTVVAAADDDAPKKKKSTRGTAAQKKEKKKAEVDQEKVDPAAEEADAEAVEEEDAASVAVDEGDASEAESLKPRTTTKAAKKGKAGATTAKKKTARQTTTRSTRGKTTPAVSEAEDAAPDQQADVSVLRKSTRARAASNASSTTTTSTVVPILRTAAAAALNKSTRSRNTTAQAAPPPTAESSAEVDAVAPKRTTTTATANTVESSDLEPVVKPPKRSASRKAAAVVDSSTSAAGGEETTDADADESIAQLARIADAALEAQGPEQEPATSIEPVPPPVPSKDNINSKKSKKVSPSASASSTSTSTSSGSTTKAKKGKKAAAMTEPASISAGEEESSSGAATPRHDEPDVMIVEDVESAKSRPAKAKATAAAIAVPASQPTSTSTSTSTAISQTATVPAPISTLPPAPPLPPTSARSPLSPTSPGTSSSRPIRALPPNKSSKSPSSTSLGNGLSLPPGGGEAVPPVPPTPAPAVTAPAAVPSQSSSQSSLPTSAFETASERLSSAILLDPNAPFTAPTNPFAGSTLLSLVPPPTQQELDTLTVAEWYSLCHRRIADRFTAESEAMQKQFEVRVEAGRTKLRGMCEEAREREEREAREEEENRRAMAKERKDRIAASGGGSRSAVKAAGGSTRKLR